MIPFGPELSKVIFAVDIEIIVLIKPRAPDIGAKLKSVVAFHPGQVVRPLETIAGLRKETLEVVTKCRSTTDVDVWHAGEGRRQAGSDSAFPSRNTGAGQESY